MEEEIVVEEIREEPWEGSMLKKLSFIYEKLKKGEAVNPEDIEALIAYYGEDKVGFLRDLGKISPELSEDNLELVKRVIKEMEEKYSKMEGDYPKQMLALLKKLSKKIEEG